MELHIINTNKMHRYQNMGTLQIYKQESPSIYMRFRLMTLVDKIKKTKNAKRRLN